MIGISNTQLAFQVLPGQPGVSSSDASMPEDALQSAADAGALKGRVKMYGSGGRPELRPALNAGKSENIFERSDVQRAIDLSKLLADLLGMILKLELNDSKMITNSSRRETALAASQASTLVTSGKASMAAGISKAAAVGLATFAGAGLAMRGLNRHITSTRTNMVRSNELTGYANGVGKNTSPEVLERLGQDASRQTAYHEVSALKSTKLQAQGSAVQQLSTLSSSTIEGSNAAITSSLSATRETLAGEASVQNRQTDVDIKARGRDESLKEQTLASIKGIIQNQLDVMSHVAQNTRA